MPKLFKFDLFEKKYARQFQSKVEEMVRRKIYLGRAVQVFIVAILYKQGKSSSYLAINHLSDRTPQELKIMMMITSMLELSDSKSGDEKRYLKGGDKMSDGILLVDDEDIERELEAIRNHSSESGYKMMAEELGFEVPGKLRTRRDIEESGQKKLHLDDLTPYSDDKQAEDKGERIEEEKTKKSPTFFSRVVNLLPAKLAKFLATISNFNLHDYIIKNRIFEGDALSRVNESGFSDGRPIPPDEVHIDHRESNCFFPPRDQGFCASCYAFAAVALHEWAHCKATGELVAFSEQYILDCGSTFSNLIKGCQGGATGRVGEFIDTYGLELRDNYPYIARSYPCPYSSGTPTKEMGFMRISYHGPQTGEFSTAKIDFYLQYSPILIGMKVNSKFTAYKGGVDFSEGCDEKFGAHAVLIVGSGIQGGEPYWIARNSFSPEWGENGYFKLSKKANCFFPDKGFLSRPIFKPKREENYNRDYNGSRIESQRQIYKIFEHELKYGPNTNRVFRR